MTTVTDGLYQYGGMPVGGDTLGLGNVYYIYDKNGAAAPDIEKRFGRKKYHNDHSNILHKHDATTSAATTCGFTSALAATKAGRNDYVVVLPTESIYEDYYVHALLTMSKKSVHLVCPAGMGPEVGACHAAIVWQKQDLDLIDVAGMSIEIAGLGFVNYDGQSSIVLTENGRHPSIHHNTLFTWWLSGAQVGVIVGSGGGGGWGSIDHNWIVGWGCAAGITCADGAIYLAAQATGARVHHNEITIGDGGIMTIGINNGAHKGMTNFNTFSSSGGVTSTAITNCVNIAAKAGAIGNLCAVAHNAAVSGGTDEVSFVRNYSASSGGNQEEA